MSVQVRPANGQKHVERGAYELIVHRRPELFSCRNDFITYKLICKTYRVTVSVRDSIRRICRVRSFRGWFWEIRISWSTFRRKSRRSNYWFELTIVIGSSNKKWKLNRFLFIFFSMAIFHLLFKFRAYRGTYRYYFFFSVTKFPRSIFTYDTPKDV